MTEDAATRVHVADIPKSISEAEAQQLESFYLEILAKPMKRAPRPEGSKAKADAGKKPNDETSSGES